MKITMCLIWIQAAMTQIFEGFLEENIAVRRGEVLKTLNMSDFSKGNDLEIEADKVDGWSKIDTPPINAPLLLTAIK
jgi:hypothetical protein